jgi:3-hydroxyisobutyrate dehydrogenase
MMTDDEILMMELLTAPWTRQEDKMTAGVDARLEGPIDKDSHVLGLVGVGDMGEGIGNSLLRAGWNLVAYDVKAESLDRIVSLGAQAASSLEDVARKASVIFVVVVDDAQVNLVIRSMLEHVATGTVFVVNSTVLPSTVIDLAGEARERGADVVDAGVAGGGEKSNLGTLTVMVGGADESVARCWPAIEGFSANPFHLGPVGAGVAAKLVNNVLSIGGYALIMEAMKLGAAYGLSEDRITEVVTLSGGDSRTIRTWGRQDRIRSDRAHYETSVLYDFLSKDVRTAAIAGGERQLILPLISAAGQLLPGMYAERDALLATREPDEIPRCTVCNQELSVSYRARGAHPECIF